RSRDTAAGSGQSLKTSEGYGVTGENVDTFKTSSDPTIKRFLGLEGGLGKMLGLDEQWVARVIRSVGNYGELYDLHFGPKALNLPRGQNNLWSHGGLHYPLPFR